MSRKKKPVKLFDSSYNSAGEIVDEGKTIRMEDGAVFKRTVIPSLFTKTKPSNIDALDFDEIEESNVIDLDADVEELAS